MNIRVPLCLLSLIVTTATFAQPTAPLALPATMPATTQAVAIDQTTPRGALKVLTKAMNSGDSAKIKSVFSPSGEVETKMVNAVVAQQAALMKFRDAAVAKFGADESKKLVGDVEGGQAESMAALDLVPEEVTGDTATVGEGDQLVHLKKTDGKWTLPVSMLAPQITAASVDQELAQVGERTKFFSDMADEVSQGKYKNADDAGKALQLKVLQQVMAHQAGATQPSTQPSDPTAPAGPGGAPPMPQ